MPYAASVSRCLTLLGKPDTKDWWERCLKGAIAFDGVPTAQIRSTVRAVQEEEQLTPVTLREASVSSRPGVGWLLRDLSVPEPDLAHAFLEGHRDEMSREAIRMAAARLPDEQRRRLGLTGPVRRR